MPAAAADIGRRPARRPLHHLASRPPNLRRVASGRKITGISAMAASLILSNGPDSLLLLLIICWIRVSEKHIESLTSGGMFFLELGYESDRSHIELPPDHPHPSIVWSIEGEICIIKRPRMTGWTGAFGPNCAQHGCPILRFIDVQCHRHRLPPSSRISLTATEDRAFTATEPILA
jgi:hypothetical protein